MHTPFRLGKRRLYPLVFPVILLVALAGLYFAYIYRLVPQEKTIELLFPIIAAVAGFVYFLYSQHHQDMQLFVSLFKEFNERYDKLNERMNAIVMRESGELTEEDQKALYDYFNLCSEEHLFYRAGYIDEEVWQAWLAGMKYFARKEAIRSFWEADLKFNSYYCFNLKLFEPTSAARKICD